MMERSGLRSMINISSKKYLHKTNKEDIVSCQSQSTVAFSQPWGINITVSQYFDNGD